MAIITGALFDQIIADLVNYDELSKVLQCRIHAFSGKDKSIP